MMLVERWSQRNVGCCSVATNPTVAVSSNPDAQSCRDAPHETRPVEIHWIEYGGRRSIGRDPGHLDVRRGVHASDDSRGQSDRRGQRRPLGDAEDARIGRGTSDAKEIEQPLFFRAVATLPPDGEANLAVAHRGFREKGVKPIEWTTTVEIRRPRRFDQCITSEGSRRPVQSQIDVLLPLIDTLTLTILRRLHARVARGERGATEERHGSIFERSAHRPGISEPARERWR